MTDDTADEQWPFDQAANVAAVTSAFVVHDNAPILWVAHYSDDDSWAAWRIPMRIAFWAFAALLVPNLVTLAAQDRSAILASPDTTVTDAERRGLHVDVDSIRHTLFRFVLPNPGSGFSLNPDYQRLVDESFAEHPDMVAWAFHDPVERQAFVIQVTKMSRVNETGFRNFTAGIPEGFGKAKIVKDSLSWRESIGDFSLTALHPAGFYITVRCLGRGQPAVIVCVQTTTAEPDALTSSRAGLRFIP